MILEPLGIGSNGLDLFGGVGVGEFNDAFPCSFETERVVINFNEAVDEVDV